jgi:hypothetical protein
MSAFKKPKAHASLAPDLASNPEVLEVNLVRDEVAVEFNWGRRLGSLFLVLVLVAALVVEIYFGLDWWQGQERTQAEKIKSEHLAATQQINNINNNFKDFLNFKDKVSLVEKLIDQHIYWSDFFTWLEQNTLNSVRYVDFSGDVSGEYALAAQTKNYRDVSWQVKAFKDNPWVDEVSVSAANLEEAEVEDSSLKEEWINFSIALKIKPQIFYRLRSQIEAADSSKPAQNGLNQTDLDSESQDNLEQVNLNSEGEISFPEINSAIIQNDFLTATDTEDILSPEIIEIPESNLPPLNDEPIAPEIEDFAPDRPGLNETVIEGNTEDPVLINFE